MKKNSSVKCSAALLNTIQRAAGLRRAKKVGPSLPKILISDDYTSYDPHQLYAAIYKYTPNFRQVAEIDTVQVNNWIVGRYRSKIKDCIYVNGSLAADGKKEIRPNIVYYFMDKDLLVEVDGNWLGGRVKFLYRTTDRDFVRSIASEIQNLTIDYEPYVPKPKVSMIFGDNNELDTTPIRIVKPKYSLSDHYNDDFMAVHRSILERLKEENSKVSVLLCGKSLEEKLFYIRYLLTSLRKDVFVLPPYLDVALCGSEMFKILLNNPNSVLVIENADRFLEKKEKDGRPTLVHLVEAYYGMLAEVMHTPIVCTFNCEMAKIDKALMDKAQTIAYEFKELTVDKSQALSNKLGFDSTIARPMSLADIYYQGEKDFSTPIKRRTMGFKPTS